jgi:Fur family transcriptional regulator, peroxide stress response regulator
MERNTSQKQIIKEYLYSIKTHPTVEEVYLAVRKRLPTISKATIYRILKNLKEKGLIQEILSDVGHFDGDLSAHAHFICKKCNKVFDVFESKVQIKFKKNIKAGEIDSHQVYFYGICNKCQKQGVRGKE